MRIQLLFAFGLIALIPLAAAAHCNDTEGTRDSIYTKCLKPTLDVANRKMLVEAKRVLSRTKSHALTQDTIAAERFLASQTQWEQFRDSHCEALGVMTSGGQSSRMLPETECKIQLTDKRTTELRALSKLLR